MLRYFWDTRYLGILKGFIPELCFKSLQNFGDGGGGDNDPQQRYVSLIQIS